MNPEALTVHNAGDTGGGNAIGALPADSEAYRFGLGALSRAITLGAASEFMRVGDLPVVQDSAYRGRSSGSYQDSWFSFFNLNRAWKF